MGHISSPRPLSWGEAERTSSSMAWIEPTLPGCIANFGAMTFSDHDAYTNHSALESPLKAADD